MLKAIRTRFRAYQLGNAGSSFSYFAGDHFTLGEARITDVSRPNLMAELSACGKQGADTLHITSWDADHCHADELGEILDTFAPARIEYPGYAPHCDNSDSALESILRYRERGMRSSKNIVCQSIDPPYIAGLEKAAGFGYRDIVYHPRYLSTDCNNDNSTVKLYRKGAFNLLSLGDVESASISAYLRTSSVVQREVDVMILAHHGADNGFTNKQFLQRITPCVAICTSNYDNHFEHPKQEIRDLLYEYDIPIFTTKTGDVLVQSTGTHTARYQVINLKANSTEISSMTERRSKKADYLNRNADTVRNMYQRLNRGPGR